MWGCNMTARELSSNAAARNIWEGMTRMTCAAGHAEPTDSPILHAAIALAPKIRASAEAIERARRIPMPIVEALKDAGVFGMAMPRAWGGPELDPLTQFRVIEALAMADGSVGWCAMINCDGGYITAFLDQEVARAMYPDLQVGTAAAATPTGRGATGVRRLSRQRTLPVRQRLPAFGMGLAGLCCRDGWRAARR